MLRKVVEDEAESELRFKVVESGGKLLSLFSKNQTPPHLQCVTMRRTALLVRMDGGRGLRATSPTYSILYRKELP